MYSLKETWYQNYDGQSPSGDWDGKMICLELDAQITFRANKTEGHSLHYSFTVVRRGWLTFIYNGREITLRPDDLYFYSPGQPLTILDASSDYLAVGILIDEQTSLAIPTVRNLVSIAYLPIAHLNGPVVALPPELAAKLTDRVREMIAYFNAEHIFKSEILLQLFSVFILDVQNFLEIAANRQPPPQRIEEILIHFLRLLPEHFDEHHDIAFYAGQLNISTSYLSRIIKQLTGRTVIEYINQMLAMEASFLLTNSSLTVSQIAARLHFADTASFSKFFLRIRGLNPREFRKEK